MNSTEIFQMALQLQKPWYIKNVELKKSEKSRIGVLDIYIDFDKGGKFLDGFGKECSAYDTEERTWKHLNFFENECFIHARVPRISTSNGEIKTVTVPWARAGSGFTLLFEAFAMLLIEYEMPVNKVASALRVISNRLWRVFNFWVKDAVNQDNLSTVNKIGIDETSSRKGHDYVTVCADLETRRVIYVCEGREAPVVRQLAEEIEKKGGNTENINHVTIDMSSSYISGVTEFLPKAKITYDKFHLVCMLNNAMDDLRKIERKEHEMLKGHKYTFLKAYSKLNAGKKKDLHTMLAAYPRLGEAYRLKQLFMDFWDIKDIDEAKGFLAFWCDMVLETDIQPFKKFVNTVKAHWTGIINYIESKINTAVMEGINNKIQLAKRRARGYRNTDNFINMIYFIAGKLKFNYPHYPL